MIDLIHPPRIIFYGATDFPFIKELHNQGIEMLAFPSKTSLAYKEVSK